MDSHPRPDHRLQALSREALSRREFLRVAASAGVFGAGVVLLGACSDDGKGSPTSTPGMVVDPPPETTTIRLPKNIFNPRFAPLYLAQQFLPAEGFTDVQYIDVPPGSGSGSGGFRQIAAGEVDITFHAASSVAVAADRGDQFIVLAGVGNSIFVLFGNVGVESLRDLKGKRIWVLQRDDPADPIYSQMAALLAYVGFDLEQDVEFVEVSVADIGAQISAGTIGAWLSTRPTATALRKENLSYAHVIIDGAVDPPWSQYFGGMVTANRDFVEKHPAATKRGLRAILKATDLCAREPERAARYLVEGGWTPYTYEETLDASTGASYAAWREFNPEDTVRFYALRLREAGLVKSTPDELIARATDWRYLDEIKREMGVT